MFPLSALKLKTFCNLKKQCYMYLAKSEENRGSGLEVSFKTFIEGKCFCYVILDIVSPNYKTPCCAEH